MFATFGSNNLLCIEDQTLDTGKKYQQNFQGYMISDKNKLLFVVHKKEIKLIELKNIGDTMGVFYTTHRKEIHPFPWEKTSLLLASQLFKGRDEQQGNHYFFLPYFSPKATITTNTLLKTLGISFQLIVNEKGVMITSLSQSDVSGIDDLPPNKEAYLSFLF
ncbi:MAG: hypothetical protein LBG59_07665 [Candidatus Peribacteria bacterium]|jgi:hypothetical protein|nr:hypothetical protein [Candidatus Peribacteria bacterium]